MTLKVFISYSHDDEEHKNWVLDLATRLRAGGVDIVLDQWDLAIGDDLPKFMEGGMRDNDRVILICTNNYVRKANIGVGGVGYEKRIASAEMLNGQSVEVARKFIPIVRGATGKHKVPTYLGAPLYLDMSNDDNYFQKCDELLTLLHGTGLQKPPLGAAPFALGDVESENTEDPEHLPSLGENSPAVEFSDRFSVAFAGSRGITWFEDENVIEQRLKSFFRNPISFSEGHLSGWWRGPENLHIDRFKAQGEGRYLINIEEFRISKIAAIHNPSYYRKCIYVETEPDEPTGLYSFSEELIADLINDYGYANEEYGLLPDGRMLTRAEYDDGATIVDGVPMDVAGQIELRVRYITPYNFLIAPNDSPINNTAFDGRLRILLNAILRQEASLEDLVREIQKLPRRSV